MKNVLWLILLTLLASLTLSGHVERQHYGGLRGPTGGLHTPEWDVYDNSGGVPSLPTKKN